MAIMPASTQPVIFENIVQFLGLVISQREMSKIIGVSQGDS